LADLRQEKAESEFHRAREAGLRSKEELEAAIETCLSWRPRIEYLADDQNPDELSQQVDALL